MVVRGCNPHGQAPPHMFPCAHRAMGSSAAGAKERGQRSALELCGTSWLTTWPTYGPHRLGAEPRRGKCAWRAEGALSLSHRAGRHASLRRYRPPPSRRPRGRPPAGKTWDDQKKAYV